MMRHSRTQKREGLESAWEEDKIMLEKKEEIIKILQEMQTCIIAYKITHRM